jgi:hypothetical protein
VALGGRDHGLQAAPRLGLTLAPLGRARPRLGEPGDEGVTHPLERLDPQQPRALPRAMHHGGRVADERGQLGLEAGDLRAQRPADGGLVRGEDFKRAAGFNEHRQPPIGARGLAPQKTWVPSIPMRWTSTMFSTIDFAVAVPTPTGPPLAV